MRSQGLRGSASWMMKALNSRKAFLLMVTLKIESADSTCGPTVCLGLHSHLELFSPDP